MFFWKKNKENSDKVINVTRNRFQRFMVLIGDCIERVLSVFSVIFKKFLTVIRFFCSCFINFFKSIKNSVDLHKINSFVKDVLSLCFVQYALCFIISLYMRFVYRTSKIIVKGHTEEYLNSLQKNNSNAVFTWHGRIFMASPFIEKLIKKISYKGNLLTVASKHKDGNLAFMAMSFFGFKKIEGSTANKNRKGEDSGAFSSALRILKELKNGDSSIFIALDGPRGPKFKINSNIVGLAQKTESTVFPVVISYSRKKEFNSWDKFQLPFPFSKIIYDFLEPIELKKDMNTEQIENEIETKMNEQMEKNDEELFKK